MTLIERFRAIKTYLKELWKNEPLREDLDYVTWLLSLLPIPVIQQAGQVANKLVSDKLLISRLDEIRSQIQQSNARISNCETDLERAMEMAKSVETVAELREKVESLTQSLLSATKNEVVVETSKYSFQAILNSWVKADLTSITAKDNSHNLIRESTIESQRTVLKADDHSSNIVDKTTIQGPQGIVGMRDIHQQGHVEVSGAAVGFGEGGSIGFGKDGALGFGPPRTVSASCNACGHGFSFSPEQAQSVKSAGGIRCPRCTTWLKA
jgi:hypothetical protein